MRQIIQSLRSGETMVVDVPRPMAREGGLLIRSTKSLISAGTERMLLEFGKASLVEKARQQPERVLDVMRKMRADGLLSTLSAVKAKLDQPLPLGYCNVGFVEELGSSSKGRSNSLGMFEIGDRVVSNGPHAEWVAVPMKLCAKIPPEVSDEAASFTVVGAIALQGIRLIDPTIGEKVVVFGLGLIGLLSVQLLVANGCDVLGIDVHPERLRLAESFGAKAIDGRDRSNAVLAAAAWTDGRGVDAVLIAASTKTSDIIHKSAQMCRKRGRIVLVGVVGMNLQRSDFYEKELTFQVSCSYGPGRYDHNYEQGGQDYPYGFVRWTEQRNFVAILELMQRGRLRTDAIITHRFELEDGQKAYDVLSKDRNVLGILLNYPKTAHRGTDTIAISEGHSNPIATPIIGVIGAGNYSRMTLMPALRRAGVRVEWLADLDGVNAKHLSLKYGVTNCTTNYHHILEDKGVNAVIVAVAHNLHARMVCECLDAGKNVLVEKPLALSVTEIKEILTAAARNPDRHVIVGFNRRFSPHSVALARALHGRGEPLAMTMTVNAGLITPEHWVHDPAIGGGRIVGEACHFVDLMMFLASSRVTRVSAVMMNKGGAVNHDKMVIALGFEDGSIGTINYFANGSKEYPKEKLEVFSDGRVGRIDNFRATRGFGFKENLRLTTIRQDKGHLDEVRAFVHALEHGGQPLIPLSGSVNVTLATFAAVTSAVENRAIDIRTEFGSFC